MTIVDLLLDSWLRLADYLRAGGVVMVPLILVSLVMWLLIVDRALFIRRLRRDDMNLEHALRLIGSGEPLEQGRHSGIITLLVIRFIAARSGVRELDRHILEEIIMGLQRSLSERLATIGVLAAIAPLLGLLGTVLGMVTTFDVMAVFGTGNAKAMAGGISSALITTQTGLLVAIPGLYMKAFLDRRATNLGKRLSAAGLYLRRHI
jgi:biopolymer transport protein ExbB